MIPLNAAETHYVLNGVEYPRVSNILEEAGVIDTRFFKEYYATRGTFVHSACEYFDRDELGDYPGDIAPFVDGYIKFRKQVPMEIRWIELPVVNRVLKYGCRIDRVVNIGGRLGVLDLKCTKVKPSYVGQQTYAHKLAYNFAYAPQAQDRIKDRWALLLPGDGNYKLTPLTDENDLPAWIDSLRRFYDNANQR